MSIKPKENILKVKPYVPGKPIEEVKRELGLKHVVKLASNENPYGPSPRVLAAIAKAAPQVNRYPDGACFYLRQELAKRLKVKNDQIIFGNGSDEVIVLAVRAFVKPGDEVVIAKPSFLIYEIASLIEGAKVRAVPLQNFRYDLAGMKAAIGPKTKIVFIGNPDNPAGTYIAKDELAKFIKSIRKDILIFLDEAYFEYVHTKDYPDGMDFLKAHKNLVVTRTFSKMYGLAGLRVGYGVGDPVIIDILNRLREPFNINSIAQAAAIACLKDQKYYRAIARSVEKERQFLYNAFEDLGLRYEESYTNFILVRVKGDSGAVAQGLLRRGVIVRDMNVWGLDHYIRVTIGSSKENKLLIKALTEVV
jgi:histidinol-phosphate aminotransferase